MKKYILFDHDGVLVETENWYYEANKKALNTIGIDLPLEEYLVNMAHGISTWETVSNAGVDDTTISECRKLRNQYYQEYLIAEDIEIPGVMATLDQLAPRFKMAIVTTSKRPDFQLIHQYRHILNYMAFALTVEDYEKAKPHPEPYLTALKKFGAKAGEAVVVEDSARGLKSAVAAGIDCIVVANQFTASHDLSAATLKIASFSELPDAISMLS